MRLAAIIIGLSLPIGLGAQGGLTITTNSLPTGAVSSPYSAQLQASPQSQANQWSFVVSQAGGGGTPPAWLNLSSAGALTGTPTSQGTFNFTVRVSNPQFQVSPTKLLSITVNAALAFTTVSTLPNGTVGAAYNPLTFTVTGGAPPYTFQATQISPFNPNILPPGMTLSQTGVLSGAPTAAGPYNFNVVATDTGGAQLTGPFSINITDPLVITTASPLPDGTLNVNYSQSFTATGGTPPYVFFLASPPAGLAMNTSGVLSGTPTATGTFNFNVAVTDSLKVSTAKPFQLTIGVSAPPLQVSPLSLNFAAFAGGDAPASQSITLVPGDASAATFRIVVDAGTANSAAPAWLTVKPASGAPPARLAVSVDQGSMPSGNYPGRIRIIDGSGRITDVLVTLVITNKAAALDVFPNLLRFVGIAATSVVQEQVLILHNSGGGGGALQFNAAVLNISGWVSITPTSGQVARNGRAYVRVRVNALGLQIGRVRDVIRISSPAGNVDIPVSLLVVKNGPIIGVSATGVRFQAQQGGGSSNPQSISVLNLGDPLSTVNWTAEVIKGGNFLTLSSSSGTATAAKPGDITLSLNPNATLVPSGGYYALLRLTDSQSVNSPLYVAIILDLAGSSDPAVPQPSPSGIFFTGTAGAQPAGRVVTVFTSSASTVPFQASAQTSDGAKWLIVTPASGRSSGLSAGQVTVTVNTVGLPPGIYTGEVVILMSGTLRTVNVTLIVLPGVVATGTSANQAALACTPAALVLTSTGLVNNFAVPAKWPTVLQAQVNDNCAGAVTNASVVASFSNGDPPLSLLASSQPGVYTATWQPRLVSSTMEITMEAAAGTLQPAKVQLTGGIAQNEAPVLATNGTLHNLNPVVGGALAPGTVSQVYGSGLASTTVSPGILPLPTSFNETFVLVGGFSAPLYYLSSGQLNVQIPNELSPNQPYSIIVSANGALTLPDTIDIVPVVPGVAAFADGHIIAQHGADFSLVDAAHPGKPGEFLIMYLAGLGPTNPSIASGIAAPRVEPLARVTNPATVNVDGQNAFVAYAGLTPGSAGLYQINFQVPANANSGDVLVVVTQSGVNANVTRLPVAR